MFLKISGCVLVFLSTLIMGFTFKLHSKKRLATLENMVQCMRYIETEIQFSLCDIIGAIEKVQKISECDNVLVFDTFLKKSAESDGITLSEIWKKSIESVSESVCYDKSDLKVLSEFGMILGSGDVDTQIKNINKLRLAIEDNIDMIKNKTSKNDELISKLGIYVGALLVIFLI